MAARATRVDWFSVMLVSWFLLLLAGIAVVRTNTVTLSKMEHDTLWLFNAEVRSFHERFAADGFRSIGVEEWVVRDYFNDKREGIFLDVGAADPIDHNNTAFLERRLGWSGIAIDARAEFAEAYRRERPRTQFVPVFVSDQDDARLDFFFLTKRPLSSSGDRRFAETWKGRGEIETRIVQTITMNTLLAKANLPRLDFLSMDIEMYEPKALAGFDIAKWRPRLVCIEAHPEIRQELMAYFSSRDYILLGKYLRIDLQNLWFIPADAPLPRVSTVEHSH